MFFQFLPVLSYPFLRPFLHSVNVSFLLSQTRFPVVSPIKNIYPPLPENAEKFAFFQNNRIHVLASLSWPFGILQKPENLFCRGNPRHRKQISHLASKSFPGGLFCNFSRYVKLCGGGDLLSPFFSETQT